MRAENIVQAAHGSLTGKIPFPKVVATLLEEGVSYYHVDYVALRKSFYGSAGEVVVTPIPFESLPQVAANFDKAGLRAAILDSQRHGQSYRDFTRRAMEAGVAFYTAFLEGKRVTYWGRHGDQHTELFPGAEPKQP